VCIKFTVQLMSQLISCLDLSCVLNNIDFKLDLSNVTMAAVLS
jgi:hypothetical protein